LAIRGGAAKRARGSPTVTAPPTTARRRTWMDDGEIEETGVDKLTPMMDFIKAMDDRRGVEQSTT
jgi:hypothetical protein